MKIAKKPKKKPQKSHHDVMMTSNYLNFSIFMIILHDVYGFGRKRSLDVFEAYLALVQELADGRNTVGKMIQSAKETTGLDIRELIDYVNNGQYDAWRKALMKGVKP